MWLHKINKHYYTPSMTVQSVNLQWLHYNFRNSIKCDLLFQSYNYSISLFSSIAVQYYLNRLCAVGELNVVYSILCNSTLVYVGTISENHCLCLGQAGNIWQGRRCALGIKNVYVKGFVLSCIKIACWAMLQLPIICCWVKASFSHLETKHSGPQLCFPETHTDAFQTAAYMLIRVWH